jgi:urease accessory protein
VAVVRLNPRPRPDAVAAAGGWQARLDLGFAAGNGRTVLARRAHYGPLRVQRPFYPPGDRACHVYVLHPPGGVVGGDSLVVSATVARGAHALLTTPAAGKLYRSDGASARLTQELRVADGAWLEWLPQETIAFDGARAASGTRVVLSGDAGFIGWEILCLGRPAAGEGYTRGEFSQRFEIWRDGAPLWWERNAMAGGAPALAAPWGLAGYSVVATLVAVGRNTAPAFVPAGTASRPALPPSLAVGQAPRLLPALREQLHAEVEGGEFSVSQLREVLVCRYLGHSAEQARAGFIAAWRLLRPALWSVEAVAPRIWAT